MLSNEVEMFIVSCVHRTHETMTNHYHDGYRTFSQTVLWYGLRKEVIHDIFDAFL